jgi:hypothetical protein
MPLLINGVYASLISTQIDEKRGHHPLSRTRFSTVSTSPAASTTA